MKVRLLNIIKIKLKLINKFNLPEPRVNIGLRLLNKVDFCTDISDGLVREIFRVANYSKIQANIFIEEQASKPAICEAAVYGIAL